MKILVWTSCKRMSNKDTDKNLQKLFSFMNCCSEVHSDTEPDPERQGKAESSSFKWKAILFEMTENLKAAFV
jgi:hypothetical protein